jgi:hypothetical protein
VPWHVNRTAEHVDVCVLNACEAYVRMRDDLANAVRPINEKLHGGGAEGGGVAEDRGSVLEARLQRLDRRLRSVEQPGEYRFLLPRSMSLQRYRIEGLYITQRVRKTLSHRRNDRFVVFP